MDQPTGIRMGCDGAPKRGGSTKSPGKKRLVDRFFLKGQEPNANLRMGVEQPASEKSFLMGVHIDEISGCRSAEDLGHIVIKYPEMAVVSRPGSLGSQADSRAGIGRRLCHNSSVSRVRVMNGMVPAQCKWFTRVPEITARSNRRGHCSRA